MNDIVYCGQCGSANPVSNKFCGKCGSAIVFIDEKQPDISLSAAEKQNPRNACPKCNSIDQIQKITTIIESGTRTTSGTSTTLGETNMSGSQAYYSNENGYLGNSTLSGKAHNVSSTTVNITEQSNLAKKFVLLHEPKKPLLIEQGFGAWHVFSILAVGLVVFYVAMGFIIFLDDNGIIFFPSLVYWMDVKDLIPGQNWKTEIVTAIQSAEIVLIFLSKKALNKRGYVQKEIRTALDTLQEIPEGKIFLIPVRLEDVELPSQLKDIHWVDIYRDDGVEKLLLALEYQLGASNKSENEANFKDRLGGKELVGYIITEDDIYLGKELYRHPVYGDPNNVDEAIKAVVGEHPYPPGVVFRDVYGDRRFITSFEKKNTG